MEHSKINIYFQFQIPRFNGKIFDAKTVTNLLEQINIHSQNDLFKFVYFPSNGSNCVSDSYNLVQIVLFCLITSDIIQSTDQQAMTMFRSTEMKYFSIHVPKQDTYEVISNLADHSFVQFIDANPNAFHRPYTNSLKRCEEVINKLKLLITKVHREGIDLPQIPNVEFIFQNHRQYLKKNNMGALALLDKIEQDVENRFTSIEKMNKGLSDFNEKINELQDYKYLLFRARQVFHSKNSASDIDFNKHTLQQLRLVNVSGLIESKDIQKFTKMIFRVTKGNSILYTFSVPVQQARNQDRPRTAFICIVESGSVLLSKINKICENFEVKKYRLPSNKDEIFMKIKQIEDNITDTKQLYVMAQKKYKDDLTNIVKPSEFQVSIFDAYWVILQRQALIFSTLNLMEETSNIVMGSIWVPTQKVQLLHRLLPSFVSIRETEAPTKPPTHFQMNEFTAPFQEIVNTYGIPRYQEVNPALYAIGIFPFLFGVMFGDIGHGGVLLSAGIFMTASSQAKKLVPPAFYGIRYLVLLMGIFSFYSGWIYNQFFSLPLNVFGSCYGEADHSGYAHRQQDTCVYPFGFDPKWFRASNDLNYFNSYKMKFAVIIGVFQMTFAIFLKMLNNYHFKDWLGLIFEWLPQQVFFFCTFGYMCILIIYKWTIHWGVQVPTSQAPSIIGQMIALPLKLGSTQGKPLWDMQSQQNLQYWLLMIAIACIPTMLIFKPLILFFQMKPHHPPAQVKKYENHDDYESVEALGKKLNQHYSKQQEQMIAQDKTRGSNKSVQHKAAHDEHEDISQIVVHQIIETIQFILGSISNTASYLRLWALSLAHGQLSKVFLEKTVGGGITSSNILIILIGMYFFFNITLGVIMGMDSMECFLHALRLQWVQFQGKFYKADGWKFQPLSFAIPIQAKANNSRNFD